MGILKSLEFIPGVKMLESGMHDALFQHSVFGAIVFLIVSNTGVYKLVKDTIFSVTGFKADGNTLQFIHAAVFAVIMYFGSMYIFAPLLTEGYGVEGLNGDGSKFGEVPGAQVAAAYEQGGVESLLQRLAAGGNEMTAPINHLCSMNRSAMVTDDERQLYDMLCTPEARAAAQPVVRTGGS